MYHEYYSKQASHSSDYKTLIICIDKAQFIRIKKKIENSSVLTLKHHSAYVHDFLCILPTFKDALNNISMVCLFSKSGKLQ